MDTADQKTRHHPEYMRRCIELAMIAKKRGDTPVGSIVVLEGEIIGEGIEGLPTSLSLTAHAEVLACQAGVDRIGTRHLTGASLYTTAEPCFMCSYVIRQCRIALVAYGVETLEIGGVTSSMPILTDTRVSQWVTPPKILGGVLQDECEALQKPRTKRM